MKTYNAQITKSEVNFVQERITPVTEKCPLSVLTGVRIKRAFRWDKQNCPQ